jgi:hypothetical protein
MSKPNYLTKTYSGVFGNQVVLKSRRGKSVIVMPMNQPAKEPTKKQADHRLKFKRAAKFAKNVLLDPVKLEAYTARAHDGVTPYNLAVKDYMNSPEIYKINVSGYKGNPGEKILVETSDDFVITSVTVSISDPAGTTIEEGPCEFNLLTGIYEFTTTIAVPDLAGVAVFANVCDLPGHSSESAVTL